MILLIKLKDSDKTDTRYGVTSVAGGSDLLVFMIRNELIEFNLKEIDYWTMS